MTDTDPGHRTARATRVSRHNKLLRVPLPPAEFTGTFAIIGDHHDPRGRAGSGRVSECRGGWPQKPDGRRCSGRPVSRLSPGLAFKMSVGAAGAGVPVTVSASHWH
jgi:hypothetical protein